MFGIDFSEILVIFAIALVVLGPQRLPKLAATIGRWLGRARAMARQFREQLEQEANRIQDHVNVNAPRGAADQPYAGHSATPTPGSEPTSSPGSEHAAAVTVPATGSSPERTYTIADAGMPEASDPAPITPPPPISEVHAGLANGTGSESTAQAHEAPSAPATAVQVNHSDAAASAGIAPASPQPAVPQRPVAVEADERGV